MGGDNACHQLHALHGYVLDSYSGKVSSREVGSCAGKCVWTGVGIGQYQTLHGRVLNPSMGKTCSREVGRCEHMCGKVWE